MTVKCDRCKVNPATIQVKTIQDGNKVDMYLCQQCAAETGHSTMNNPFEDFFKSLLDLSKENQKSKVKAEVICPMCNMTYKDFRKIGKVGCANCYRVFDDEINYVLKRIHGSTGHVGKIPEIAGETIKRKREINRLKEALKKAIETEAYEDAVELRDQIKALEKEE